MSKLLTDKWRARKLNKAWYYLKFPDTEKAEIYNLYDMEKFRYVQDSDKIDVLSEVPSYESWENHRKTTANTQIKNCDLEIKLEQVEKKLEIATRALEELEIKSDKFYRGGNDWSLVEQLDFIKAKCQETLYHLKEMEGVK